MNKRINPDELKTIKSIAAHFPKSGGKFGVSTGYLYRLINDGRISFETIEIEGTKYFIIPEEDLDKPDWGLRERLKSEN